MATCIVHIRREDDQDPDLSYLEGRHLPHNPKNWSHVSKKDIEKAFNSLPVEWQERFEDGDFDTKIETLDNYYDEQDRERLKLYGDDWNMIGIWAEAEVIVNDVVQTIRSGGLWGIESDSGRDYFREVEAEQVEELKDILKKMGIRCGKTSVVGGS